MMGRKYSIVQFVLGIWILFAFSGCSKFGPEYGVWGDGRVNPSGVNQLFDKKFEEIDLITLLDPKGKAKEGFLVDLHVIAKETRREADKTKEAATAAKKTAAAEEVRKKADKAEAVAIVAEAVAESETKEGITWKGLSDQEKLDRAFEAFYHADYAADGKRRRNQVQERILAASDNRCNLYKAYMKNLHTRTNFFLGATTTILGGAGAIVGGAAARTYAGAAGVVSGVRSEFDQAYYSRKTFGLVATGIDKRREELHNKMRVKRAHTIENYTVEEAVSDAILYHGACSMDSGLDEAAKAMQMDYNFGIKQVAGTIEHAKKAAVFAKEMEAIEKEAEAAAMIKIENIEFKESDKIAITIRNRGGTAITVDKIYLNNKIIPMTSRQISPKSAEEIVETYKWTKGEECTIKIATTTGLKSETLNPITAK